MKIDVATEGVGCGAGLSVLIVNSVLTGGGVDTQTLSQCQALIGEGARVTLAVSSRARWVERAQAIEGLSVLVFSSPRWRWPLRLAAEVRRRQVQVLHAHHGRDYWVAILARMLSMRPAVVVVTRHLMTRLKDKTRRYLAAFTRVVAVSDAVLRSLHASDPKGSLRLRRVYCGIDTAAFSPNPGRRAEMRAQLGLPADGLVFAVVGAIHAPDGKGQFHFVRAATQVLAHHPDVHFLCAGSGEAVPALKAAAAREGLGAHFHWQAFGHDIPGLMQAIDVLVHPAVSSEALGLVLLEALSCGKPVIGSRLDGIPETFEDGQNGIAVPPRDVDALAQAMLCFADDRALTDEMGARGRAWVEERFSLRHVGQETIRYYRDALAGRA